MNNNLYKEIIIKHLNEQGFVTFAERFRDIDFVITEMYNGSYCPTAFMSPKENIICINPGFFELQDPNDEKEKKEQLDKVSVLIRHELLHFLLTHERRFVNYLKAKYPHSWGRIYADPTMHRIANFAMDYDLCNEAYEDTDKEIIKNLTVNGKFVGGLITEEQVKGGQTAIWFDDGTKEVFSGSQFNNWENTKMEDMWQMLHDAHNNYIHKDPADFGDKTVPGSSTPVATDYNPEADKEYKEMFDKVVKKFGNGKASVAELTELFGRLLADEDVDLDNWKFEYSEQLKGKR